MSDVLPWVNLVLSALTVIVVIVFWTRQLGGQDASQALRDELRASRDEFRTAAKELRQEIADGFKNSFDVLKTTLTSGAQTQQMQFDGISKQLRTQLETLSKQFRELNETGQEALERIRKTLDERVQALEQNNEKKLDEIRRTVDEKLQDTLEKRLGESFKLVSERLEAVHKGLGEMQNLAAGVGDLKRVLTNVKTRGTWGEVQLGAILEQILAADQYAKNVAVKKGAQERVEYAIRLPGPKENPKSCIWLPIDSKFPQEDYLRLQDAAEKADADAVREASKALADAVRRAARDIRDKYVHPPDTTDFAVMFLATEGLYAEVLRLPGFVEELQSQYRIVVAGPATISALLVSLRMGFQTLAVEQRAAEIWKILGAVKSEFANFGELLDKVKKHLDTVTKAIEKTGTRSRAIERKLREVEQLPAHEDAGKILDLPNDEEETENGEE